MTRERFACAMLNDTMSDLAPIVAPIADQM